jgi:hypothetical protein
VTQYEHTQIGHVAIWPLLVPAILFALGAMSQRPPDQGISFLISLVFLITIALFYKLTITIENDILHASFGIGIIRKTARLTEIVGCAPFRIRWWYGWGIHLTPYGWLYNVSGLDALAITLRNGRKFALGTEHPHELSAAIRSLLSRS